MGWFSSRQAKTSINHYSRKDTNHHIKGSDTAANRRTLVVVPIAVDIDDRLGSGRLDRFTTLTDTEMDLNTAANWDTTTPTDYTTAANRAGKDFYIYACLQAGSTPKLLLSDASTYPSGYTANNSRKIGGFHGMPGACVSLPTGHPYKDFEQGAILFNSIWDLLDKSRCSPEGMAKISLTPSDGRPALWVDIYLMSGTGTTATSVFGATIQDNVTWHNFSDYIALQGKRMLTNVEYQVMATGSNEKTSITGGTDPVTVTFPVDSAGRSMISNYGVIGAVGLQNSFLSQVFFKQSVDGTVLVSSPAQSATVYHVASPGGNPIYAKYMADGTPYLCCNMATDTVDKWVTFGTDYKILIKHDADAATNSTQVYFDDDGTQPGRLLSALARGKTTYIESNNAAFPLQLTYSATASSVGVALCYDDGTDERLEATLPSAANASLILAMRVPVNSSLTSLANNKGSIEQQGGASVTVMIAGGKWSTGASAGSCYRLTTWPITYTDTGNACRCACDPA